MNTLIIIRNILYNFGGQVIVALVAVIIVPSLVRALGYDVYGLLSLALTVFSSLSLIDLGLSRATTKFVAEYLSKGKVEVLGQVIWTSFCLQVIIGIVGGFILAIATPFIAYKILNVPKELIEETQKVLFILAFSAPVVLGSSSLRGALEAAQRFDLVNIIKVILNILTYVVPLFASQLGVKITGIIFILFFVRLAIVIVYLVACFQVFPSIKHHLSFNFFIVFSLFSYAKWIALLNLILPFFIQLDRYFLAAFVSMEAVTFYSVPFELLNGLWIIPGAISVVLFPTFSSLMTAKGNKSLTDLYVGALKGILIILGPIVLIALVFSREILQYWQNLIFAEKSAQVLRILLVGALINSLAYIPLTLLLAFDLPNLVVKFSLIELFIYLPLAYLFINKYSIIGASIVFTMRVTIDAIFLFTAVWRFFPSTRKIVANNKLRFALGLLLLFGFSLWVVRYLCPSLTVQIASVIVLMIIYMFLVIRTVLDFKERMVVLNVFRQKAHFEQKKR